MHTQAVHRHVLFLLHGLLYWVHYRILYQNLSIAQPLINRVTEETESSFQQDSYVFTIMVLWYQGPTDILMCLLCAAYSQYSFFI